MFKKYPANKSKGNRKGPVMATAESKSGAIHDKNNP